MKDTVLKKELTCIVCPLGCSLTAEIEAGKIKSVSGNTCPRGAAYAEAECLHPVRTLTSTVKCEDGTLVPVKTSTPIDKDKIFECMKIINSKIISLPVSIGDVIIEDVFGSSVIATANRK